MFEFGLSIALHVQRHEKLTKARLSLTSQLTFDLISFLFSVLLFEHYVFRYPST
jgi:hypothetical protein